MKVLSLLSLVLVFSACGNENTIIEQLKKYEMNEQTATSNKETVRNCLKLLEQENITAMVDLFAEDGKQVNPYASGLFPEGATGKQGLLDYWTPVPGNFDGMEFPISEIYAMEDSAIVYVKFQGKIKLKNGAGFYQNDYYAIFKFNEAGKITEYTEIFNPIVAARGFGMLDQIK